MEKTAYEILGVSETATDEEIKKQYHTLMRNVHTDATAFKDLTEEERQECEKLVREYNDAYGKLHKGRRSSYDEELAQKRENRNSSSDVIYSEPSDFKTYYGSYDNQKFNQSSSESKKERPVGKSAAQKIIEQILMNQLDDLMRDILKSGFSFSGSYTVDPNQKLKQNYWKLKSEKEKLEKDLRTAEQEAEIEFMKKSSTNEIQLNIDFNNLFSQISSCELKRNTELASVQQNYVFKASKRFITKKKREKLRQQLEKEQEQINAKYNAMIEMYKEKQKQNRIELEKYQKDLRTAVESNPKVVKIKAELSRIQLEFNSMEEQLGYQTRTSDYTSSYGERSRVSV